MPALGSKYTEGDQFGNLTITLVLGQSRTGRGRREWFYHVRCDCKHEERASQRALREGKRACDLCTRRRASSKPQAPKFFNSVDLPPDVPDFARLPASTLVGKPEEY